MLTATSASFIIDSGISPMSGLAISVELYVELPSAIFKNSRDKNLEKFGDSGIFDC